MKDHKAPFRHPKLLELVKYIYWDLNPAQGIKLLVAVFFLIASILGFVLRIIRADIETGWIDLVLLIIAGVSLVYSLANLFLQVFKKEGLKIEPDLEADSTIASISGADRVPGAIVETVLRTAEIDAWLRAQPTVAMQDSPNQHELLRSFLRTNSNTFERLLRTNFSNSRAKGKQFSNDKKICLCSDLLADSKIACYFIGSYFDTFCTNEFSAKLIRTTTTRPERVATGLNFFPATGNRLKPIATSRMSNQIGISTVAITSDGFIRLWRQGEKNQLSEGLVVATGSGSLDQDDLDSDGDLLRTICNGMEREFREESSGMGLEFETDPVLDTRVTGYFRWVRRGGKPEFVGVTRLRAELSELEPNESEVEAPGYCHLEFPARSWEELESSIRGNLSRYTYHSVSCWVALKCLLDIAEARPKSWEHFLFGKTRQ